MKSSPTNLPKSPGVYLFKNKNGEVIYVGKAINLKSRVNSYFLNRKSLGPKTLSMINSAFRVDHISVESEIEALLLEARLIWQYQPKFNTELKDDGSPLYIKITTGDETPQITTARRQKQVRGVKIFGPFPSSRNVRVVLKTLRRIFPYCTHSRRPKSCLFVHLGLCPDPYADKEAKIAYQKTIKNIVLFLKGERKRLLAKLIKEMTVLSKEQQFEKANDVKKQIEAIVYVTQNFRQPEEYLARPDLIDDLANQRMRQLKSVLNLARLPRRIECYDISNLSGKQATGSMIVFTNGKADKNQYRKFKIKFKNTPDDYAMIQEIISRRLKNNWKLPDLFVIDGGKGQLSAAKRILDQNKLNIPIITLAKRLEEIFVPGKTEPLKLTKNSPALQLAMQLRDESHRFAISYHRKLRSKAFLKSV